MDAKTWLAAKEWLVEAAAMPESERAAFLATRCPDEALRRELLEMLASDTTLSGLISMSTLTSGTRLGPYEIETVIGAGGMGEVYRARDGRLGRDVAIKVLPALFATDRDRLARFEREAKLLASLNHPHICTLFDVGRDSGTDYIVMECIDGELLSDRLRKGPLPVDKAVSYAIEVADALDKAHALGIVHRDLKPGNVMLTKSGTKLLDFGLARSTQAPRDVTKTGTILGTLRYMSPEQLKGSEADARSDVWAFGCVLYQMLSGRTPFDSASEAAIGAAILEAEPPPVSTIARGVPPALQRVIDRCLAKAPDDRWQSLADLRHELEWIAKPGAHAGDVREPRVGRSRREWIAWGTAALMVIVTAAAVSYVAWNARHALAPPFTRLTIPLPDALEQAGSFALSRDGRQLAFVGRPRVGSAPPLIWVRSIVGGADARPLKGTERPDTVPFWNPDGTTLGFFADGKLKTVDVTTGVIHVKCPAPKAGGGTWAGQTILFSANQAAGVFRVTEGSDQVTQVTWPQANERHTAPSFLPDGVHFVFTSMKDSVTTIKLGSLGDTRLTELTSWPQEGVLGRGLTQAFVAGGMLVWAHEGFVVARALDGKRWQLAGPEISLAGIIGGGPGVHQAFAVSDTTLVYRLADRTPAQLTWLSKEGDSLSPVWEPKYFRSVELSPDETKAVVACSNDVSLFMWLIDLARKSAPVQLTLASSSLLLWSPAGDRVLFRKPGKESNDYIYSILVEGGADEKIVVNHEAAPVGWSDTGALLYSAPGKSGIELWTLPSSGDARMLIPAVNSKAETISVATRKGDLVASVVGNNLYVQPIRDRGAAEFVDRGDIKSPRWSADGHELYYWTAGHVKAVAISGVGHLQVGAARQLFDLHDPWFSPSKDGRFLAAVRQPSGEPPTGIVLNWTSPHDK